MCWPQWCWFWHTCLLLYWPFCWNFGDQSQKPKRQLHGLVHHLDDQPTRWDLIKDSGLSLESVSDRPDMTEGTAWLPEQSCIQCSRIEYKIKLVNPGCECIQTSDGFVANDEMFVMKQKSLKIELTGPAWPTTDLLHNLASESHQTWNWQWKWSTLSMTFVYKRHRSPQPMSLPS